MDLDGVKPTAKDGRSLLPVLAVVAILLPLGIGAWVYSTGDQGTRVRIEETPVETLVVKMVYSPELAAYVRAGGHGHAEKGRMVEVIGDFLRIEWLIENGEIRISVANETIHTLKADELKKESKLLNLTVRGFLVNVTVAIFDIPYLRYREPPDTVKSDVLVLLENQSFIKWLKGEGFTYAVGRMDSLTSRWPLEFDKIAGVAVELAFNLIGLEDLKILYHLYFDEPYVLMANATIPEELEESPYEQENYGVYFVYMYRYSEGRESYAGSGAYGTLPPQYQNITRYETASGRRRLTFDITSETGQKVMRILGDNRLTDRVMKSFRCEVREIVRWVSPDTAMDATAIVALVCEEKGYTLSVRIDLNAEVINEIYFYPFVYSPPRN